MISGCGFKILVRHLPDLFCHPWEKQALAELMMQKQEVFALTENKLGETELVEHSIQLNDTIPIRTPPWRLPYALRNELDSELQKLLNIRCIEPSFSSFASGLCVTYVGIELIPKKPLIIWQENSIQRWNLVHFVAYLILLRIS